MPFIPDTITALKDSMFWRVLRFIRHGPDYLWKLTWHNWFKYSREYKHFDIGWTQISVLGKIVIPLQQMRARIRTERGIVLYTIEETPHFRWIYSLVMNNENVDAKNDYIRYIMTYEPNWIVDRRLEEVASIIEWVKTECYTDMIDFNVVVASPKFNLLYRKTYFEIIDGVHRASILRAFGIAKMMVYVLK